MRIRDFDRIDLTHQIEIWIDDQQILFLLPCPKTLVCSMYPTNLEHNNNVLLIFMFEEIDYLDVNIYTNWQIM